MDKDHETTCRGHCCGLRRFGDTVFELREAITGDAKQMPVGAGTGVGMRSRRRCVGVELRSALMVSGPEAGCQHWLGGSAETVTQKSTLVRKGNGDRVGGWTVTMERAQGWARGRGVAVGVELRSALMVSGPEAGCQQSRP